MVTPGLSRSLLEPVVVLLFFALATTACAQQEPAAPDVDHIEPSDETGTSLATAVGEVPLVFTTQVFPYDDEGEIASRDDADVQIAQVLSNVEEVLEAAGTRPEALVRLNVYLADDTLSSAVEAQLAELLPVDARPAVTFVSGTPTRPGALVSMDAVATAPETVASGRRSLYRAEPLHSPEGRAHAAVLAPGRKLFIAGQAEMADDLQEATGATMQGLLATLAYAGASAEDVAHVKAFINPTEEAEQVEEEIAGFFRGEEAPPIVTLEWQSERLPTEIELVAAAPEDPEAQDSANYYAPPWMEQATTFSRLVDVHRGGLLFTSGLYGEAQEEGEAQARTIFDTLTRLLDEAGSGYDYLVKGTYYPSTDEARGGFTDVRPDFFNPERPPAASLAEIDGAGRPESSLTVDMISVIPE